VDPNPYPDPDSINSELNFRIRIRIRIRIESIRIHNPDRNPFLVSSIDYCHSGYYISVVVLDASGPVFMDPDLNVGAILSI
jgi:hypothetical protein